MVETNPHGLRHELHHVATIVAKKIESKYHWAIDRLFGAQPTVAVKPD